MTSTRHVRYELRYIPVGGGNKWVSFDRYMDRDDERLIKNYEVYLASSIISKVEVVEIITTTTTIDM
ncbi:hypothetical protein [Pseudoalteromonas phage C7]|uniref:hypothetical protein n=1 Tax=Pseudoalteromonas phage C7 TaxID=2510494 RepID=UPI001018DDD2|nr:hypothetical protein PP587_gp11 [Pseudoalteromonas phage C7]QAY17965.1 hypothetical protein [Pseudoalteromonas phage C7]